MSLRLRRIAVDGFRKFREPMAIEGLTDGLNIIIEPNETGKSTLLEALRAAFFVRHGTKNQLAQSFAPYGEAVGPEIQAGPGRPLRSLPPGRAGADDAPAHDPAG